MGREQTYRRLESETRRCDSYNYGRTCFHLNLLVNEVLL